ncbi:syntaxin/epimorphin, conserved site-containing protein, partial [Tanacetum coccineum]
AAAMKAIKQRMESDVDEVGMIARFIKAKIEQLDKELVDEDNGIMACDEDLEGEEETTKRVHERMCYGNNFVVVTGIKADEEVVDTLAEIQERHDAVIEVERKLLELQQIFMDLAILVDAQGEMLDSIETHVSSALDHVQSTKLFRT